MAYDGQKAELLREANDLQAQLVDEQAAHAKTCANFEDYVEAARERELALAAAIARVRAIHSSCDTTGCRECHECNKRSPCRTLRAIWGVADAG